jgi:hypothetical protein
VRALQHFNDPLHHARKICQNVIVPKAQHAMSTRFQKISSGKIRRALLRVLSTIKLDHQATLHAAEIDNVRSYRMLTAKFSAAQLPISKAHPEFGFNISLLPAQLTRASLLSRWIR